jgi:hypothetical protein
MKLLVSSIILALLFIGCGKSEVTMADCKKQGLKFKKVKKFNFLSGKDELIGKCVK